MTCRIGIGLCPSILRFIAIVILYWHNSTLDQFRQQCTISVVHSAAGQPSRAHTTWTREAPTMAQATTMAHAMKTTLRPLHDRVLVKRLDEHAVMERAQIGRAHV